MWWIRSCSHRSVFTHIKDHPWASHFLPFIYCIQPLDDLRTPVPPGYAPNRELSKKPQSVPLSCTSHWELSVELHFSLGTFGWAALLIGNFRLSCTFHWGLEAYDERMRWLKSRVVLTAKARTTFSRLSSWSCWNARIQKKIAAAVLLVNCWLS